MSGSNLFEYQSIYNAKKRNIIPVILDYLNYVLGVTTTLRDICEIAECEFDKRMCINIDNKAVVKSFLSKILINLNIGLKIFDTTTKIISNTIYHSLQPSYVRIDAVKCPSKYLYVAKYSDKYELIIFFPAIDLHCTLNMKKFNSDGKSININTSTENEITYSNPSSSDYESDEIPSNYKDIIYFKENIMDENDDSSKKINEITESYQIKNKEITELYQTKVKENAELIVKYENNIITIFL